VSRPLLVAALALALAGPASASTGSTGEGARLYAEHCSSCHDVAGRAPDLHGVGALAPDFELTTGYMPLASPGDEPKRGTSPFTAGQIRELVAYIASLGPGPAIPRPHPARGNLAEGLSLFTDHCAGCHQVAARGGYVPDAVAPPLDRATPTQIAEAVRLGPYYMPRFTKRQISDRQLDSIVRYVVQTRNPDNRGGWSIGLLGPIPEGLVTWLVAAAALVGCCVLIGKRAT
jgi:quinol---cytochrome-c reductase cytochrome c subunit